MGLLLNLNKTVPPDFRFPILTKLADLCDDYKSLLETQLVANPPLSMIKIKDICRKKVLDERPLIIRLFVKFCNEFLKLIHASDFCVPVTPRLSDSAFILMQDYGFNFSFEDRNSLRFRNEQSRIQVGMRRAEMEQAKQLAERHREHDDLLRAVWNEISAGDIQWLGPKPKIPPPTQVYNECEPQVVGNTIETFSWFDRPRPEIYDLVQSHVPPVIDEMPNPEKFPLLEQFIPPFQCAKRLTFQQIVPVSGNTSEGTLDDRRPDNLSTVTNEVALDPLSTSQPINPNNSDTSVNNGKNSPRESTPRRTRKSKTAQSLQRILDEIRLDNESFDNPPWAVVKKTKKKNLSNVTEGPTRKSRRLRKNYAD